MKSPGKKSERLNQLELLLVTHPEGLRRAEIARRLGVHRATVGRYIDELSTHVPIWERDYLIGIKSNEKNTLMKLTLLESLTFYLAFRSLQQNLGIRFPAGASAIRKISRFLQSYAPFISSRMTEISDFLDSGDRKSNSMISLWLEILAEAWITASPVNVSYMEKKKKIQDMFNVCSVDLDSSGKAQDSLIICLRKVNNGNTSIIVNFTDIIEVKTVPAIDSVYASVAKGYFKKEADTSGAGEKGTRKEPDNVSLLVGNEKYLELLKRLSSGRLSIDSAPRDGAVRCVVESGCDELLLGLVAASGGDLIIESPPACVDAFIKLRIDIARSIDTNVMEKD